MSVINVFTRGSASGRGGDEERPNDEPERNERGRNEVEPSFMSIGTIDEREMWMIYEIVELLRSEAVLFCGEIWMV